MAILELVRQKPDWKGALTVAMTRPPGVPERRTGDDPWNPAPAVSRPRRISDDLAWFRRAVDEPAEHGLQPIDGDRHATAWESDNDVPIGHLTRLRDRGVLAAAGFELHVPQFADA
jgi:hypothetical protein